MSKKPPPSKGEEQRQVGSTASGDAASSADGSYVVHGYCKMCIGPACGILAKVKNGVVTEITGDPEHPANEGKLCPRGASSINSLYNPYRVKTPLKRTNPEKGLDSDPGWVEISWDEALETITGKLAEILKEDPRGLIFLNGFGSKPDNMPVGDPVFAQAFGTPNVLTTNGALCPLHLGWLNYMGSFTGAIDATRINYLVCIGHSPAGDFTKASSMAVLHGVSSEALQNALDRGLKLIVVNPHAGPETKRAEWVPIIPGTDLPFLLAMSHVILHEIGEYDEWFLRVRTNLPYLIREDGAYLRDAKSNKPVVWSLALGKAAPWDDATVSNGRLNDPGLGAAALEGSYQVNGEPVRPAFEIVKEHTRPYTAEWAEGLTGIPAANIRRITRELVDAAQIGSTIRINGVTFPYRPAGVFCGRGAVSHYGGNYVMDATNLVNGLLGATDVPGSITGESFKALLGPGPDGTVIPNPELTIGTDEWIPKEFKYPPDHFDLSEFFPFKHSTAHVAWRAISQPEVYIFGFEPKAMIILGANPITNNSNSEEVIAALMKIPFIVTIAYHLDEPTQFADIVLAESSGLERLHFKEYQAFGPEAGKRGLQGFNFRHPIVGPIYNTRDANAIMLELINRLHINPRANAMLNRILGLNDTSYELMPAQEYTWEELVEMVLKARFGDDRGMDYFKIHGSAWTAEWLPEEKTYNYFYFPDGQTRHPIYNEYLLTTGRMIQEQCSRHGITIPGWEMDEYMAFFQPLPQWIPHPEHRAKQEFDLFAVNWKINLRAFGMGGLEEIAAVRETQLKQNNAVNSMLVNTETARLKGLKDGDRVICESQYGGKVRGFIKTTELIHPKTVGFPGNFGRQAMFLGPRARDGLNYNQLLSSEDGNFDPVIGAIDITAAVKLTKVR